MKINEAIDWCEQFRDNIVATGVEKEKYTLALKAMRTVITALNNQVSSSKWIPVTERLPEENGYYLCCVKSFCFPGRTYINILKCDKDGFMEGHIYTDDVTHWMPLPEPPKAGESQ